MPVERLEIAIGDPFDREQVASAPHRAAESLLEQARRVVLECQRGGDIPIPRRGDRVRRCDRRALVQEVEDVA